MKNFIIAAGRKIRHFLGGVRNTSRGAEKQGVEKKAIASSTASQALEKSGSDQEPASPVTTTGQPVSPILPREDRLQEQAGKVWSVDDFKVVPMPGKSRFHDYEIPAPVMHAIADLGFEYCTPIQEKSLAAVLAGQDLVGKANTGTGKTAVFLIAILCRLLAESGADAGGRGRKKRGVKALILAPTRELVMQIAKDARKLTAYCNISINAVYGGADYQKQLDALREGRSDIVVATPGRLLDFAGKQAVHLDACRILVLDEADRMLDMGFIPDVRRIVGRLPEPGARQTMMFSATVPGDVQRLAYQWCVKPEIVEAETDQVAVDAIEQAFYLATTDEKYVILLNLINAHPQDRIIIFANMKNETRRLAERLQRDGIDCVLLSGDVAQDKRIKRLERFRAGNVKVLVATDVAGRGIHIEGITMVVNYMLPYEPEDYVHRIGRTGRAGAQGRAVSFACEQGAFYLPAIEEFVGHKIECVLPDEALLAPPEIKRRPAKKAASSPSGSGGRRRSRPRRPRKGRTTEGAGGKQQAKEAREAKA